MKVTALNHIYKYDGVELPVPSHLQGDETGLRSFHSTIYPAIATADVTTKKEGDTLVTEYRRTVGTKG